jgi:hypothetical protein
MFTASVNDRRAMRRWASSQVRMFGATSEPIVAKRATPAGLRSSSRSRKAIDEASARCKSSMIR